jgi:hypothetical protein
MIEVKRPHPDHRSICEEVYQRAGRVVKESNAIVQGEELVPPPDII